MTCPTEVNCIIQLNPTSEPRRVHVNKIKPHLGRIPPEWVDYPVQPVEERGEVLNDEAASVDNYTGSEGVDSDIDQDDAEELESEHSSSPVRQEQSHGRVRRRHGHPPGSLKPAANMSPLSGQAKCTWHVVLIVYSCISAMFCSRCGKDLTGQSLKDHLKEAHPKGTEKKRTRSGKVKKTAGRAVRNAARRLTADQARPPPPPIAPQMPDAVPGDQPVPPPPNPWAVDYPGSWTFTQTFKEYPGGAKAWTNTSVWQPAPPQSERIKVKEE